MKERLFKLITHLGYTATKLADEISVQRSGISHILSGRNQPSYDFIVKILTKFPEINAEWLLLGKGSMINDRNDAIGIELSRDNIKNSMKQPDLFNTSKDIINSLKNKQSNSTMVTNVTSVVKLLLLNDDGTFEVYKQAKKE